MTPSDRTAQLCSRTRGYLFTAFYVSLSYNRVLILILIKTMKCLCSVQLNFVINDHNGSCNYDVIIGFAEYEVDAKRSRETSGAAKDQLRPDLR
jgi:hypothetical protein